VGRFKYLIQLSEFMRRIEEGSNLPYVVLKPEVKVLAVLLERPKRFSELKAETGLSDPWLAKTLGEMVKSNLVLSNGKEYAASKRGNQLLDVVQKPAVYSHFLIEKAVRVAKELADDPRVLAVILFGTVARLEADPESDLDLLIVVSGVENEIDYRIMDLEVKYDVPIEAVTVSLDGFKRGLYIELGLIFGILSGYLILVDKDGVVTRLLLEKEEEVRGAYILNRGTMLWLRR